MLSVLASLRSLSSEDVFKYANAILCPILEQAGYGLVLEYDSASSNSKGTTIEQVNDQGIRRRREVRRRENEQQVKQGTHRGHMGAALFVLALMDNLQNVFTNTSHDPDLAAVGSQTMEYGAIQALRSRCMGFLQQAFLVFCQTAAARESDPSGLQGGEMSKAAQVGSPALIVMYCHSQLCQDSASMPANEFLCNRPWSRLVAGRGEQHSYQGGAL